MKKIVIVGPAYPYRGGIAAFSDRLALAFQSDGYDVEIVTFTLQYPSFLFPGKTQFSEAKAPEELTISRQINSVNPLNWRKVGRALRKKNADCVVFAYWMSFFAPCYARIAREVKRNGVSRCIGLIHNMLPHEPSFLDKLLPPCFVKAMDGFVALSKAVLDDVARLDRQGKPKCFAPHPLYDHFGPREPREVALRNLHLPENYRYMLFFGLMRAYQGLDLLLKAFADARLREMPLHLIVAGEFYDAKQPYIDLIKRLGLESRVTLCDQYIPDEAVKDYFNAADIVVQPYKSATQSGVTQIAYHFEKPMLVTDVGGLREIVLDGKVGYVTAPNAEKIADALVDFFRNERKSKFEENIVAEKRKYSWSRLTETIINVVR